MVAGLAVVVPDIGIAVTIVAAPVVITIGAIPGTILFRLLAAEFVLPATFVAVSVVTVVIVQELLGLAHEVVAVGARRRR
jgi:hypothetical protein